MGVLGGLIGLGGAEFRLPILVSWFGYQLRQAVSLNLAVSLVTVCAALATRLAVGGTVSIAHRRDALTVIVFMVAGSVTSAFALSRTLARMDERALHRVVRGLLLGIGALLIVESALNLASPGIPLAPPSVALVAVGAGLIIGAVSSLLGVAGGELIIPTLILVFGFDVGTAGTASLLISVPTVMVGVLWQRALLGGRGEIYGLVVPMGAGSIIGAVVGGIAAAHAPARLLKLVLGMLLIVSALRALGRTRSLKKSGGSAPTETR